MNDIAHIEIVKGPPLRGAEGFESFGYSWRCGKKRGNGHGLLTQREAAYNAREDIRLMCGGVLVVTDYLTAREAV